jgi:uncharacterized LabA/DUF88 family protein
MERITVYVDGFNFYYGLKRMKMSDSDWQQFYWIDLVKFFDHFKLNGQILRKVYYFTTPPLNIQKKNRQGLLFLANNLLNGNRFEVIEGKFYEKEYTCPNCKHKYTIPEEKRTDVNICAQMMLDCTLNNTDVLILVSADSDLVPPLELIKKYHPDKKIRVFFPPKGFSYDLSFFMKADKSNVLLLKKHKIRFTNSIMPDVVTKDGITYTIPHKWKTLK